MTTMIAPPRTAHPTWRPLTDVGVMVAREIRRTVRSVDMLITGLALPVLIMLVFVIVFGGAAERDGNYITYVVPAILILCTGFGSAVTAVTVAKDMREGIIDRFRTMPIFGASVLVGHVIASIIRNLSATVVVIAVAVGLGYRPDADLWHWILTALYLAFAITAFTWVCCAAGLLLSEEAAGSVNFVFLFLPYISSGFVPVDTMPQWLRGFANHEPFTPIIETTRSLLTGTDPGGTGWVALGWLVGFLAVGYVASVILFRHRTRR
jgi:ABC-2 type transport system permease protein